MSQAVFTLREWETLQPKPGSPLASRTLRDDRTRRLAEDLAETGSIEVLELARGLEIRATQFVGRVQLGEITITVQPKLSGAPFINLLRYAYGLRQLKMYEAVEYATFRWAFQDLLIQQLAAEAADLMARGVHREYEREHADLSNPRGRIDFQRLVGMVQSPKGTLPCVHYPRTEDTLLNQVVLAGLAYAVRLVVDPDLRAHLIRLVKALTAAVSLKRLSLALLDEARQEIDRRTTVYMPALTVIELLLKAEGISLAEETKRVSLPGFLFDMNRFFQALISRFLHDYLGEYEIQDEYRLKDLFFYDPRRNPQRRTAAVPRPDFVIQRNRRISAVLDAKYRDLWERPLPREMLYQLALYALGQRREQSKAVILYPTLASNATDQAIQVRNPSSGLVQAEVILRPVQVLQLELLLRSSDWKSNRRKAALARHFAFGGANEI